MNPLKGRKIGATTKTITTLFICGSLLVGFMGVSLTLTQTAMAQPQGPPEERPTPQCDPGFEFNRGFCEREVCPPGSDDPLPVDGVCTVTEDEDPLLTCEGLAEEGTPEFVLENGECKRTLTETPTCGPGNVVYDPVDRRCEVRSGAGAGNPTGVTPQCRTSEGFTLVGNECQKTETEDPLLTCEGLAEEGEEPFELIDGRCIRVTEVDPDIDEERPGQGNPN